MGNDRVWQRWDEVDGLLEAALDLPPEEREPYLRRACGGDEELLGLLRRLVQEDEGDVPAGPAAALFRAALTDPTAAEVGPAETLEGRTIGVYRLGRVLGAGGMGTVYLGERADGVFERRVAVKVLHQRVGTGDLAARFRQERRILASLGHGGIAQLIDGGVTADGRSYLVMEHVEGVPIDRYARDHELDVEARIRLLLQAAEAVEHAHRHMVVHRDLKPSNILVTDAGVVKLLDFGIAKLLHDSDDDGAAPRTRTEHRFATLEYAAPEQLVGEVVSAQTDVYGLSVVLYELLTGSLPYGRRGEQSVLERVIAGDEPTAPSAVVAASATTGAAAEPGSTSRAQPTALRKRLAGDLDAILLKGLRARPEERYASVAALREDLERHLAGRAVAARGDARMYRFRRFVRRQRVPLGIAAGVFLLVAGSAAGLAVQRGALLEERDRAARAAAEAAREAETSGRVTSMLVSLFEAADPLARDTITVQALLARGAERIDDELGEEPEVRAALLDVLGRVHGSLGRYDDAETLLSRAVALRRDTLPDRAGLAASLAALGNMRRVAREFEPAVVAYRDALAEAARTGADSIAAEARLGMAQAWVLSDATDSAEVAFTDGIARLNALPAPSTALLLDALVGLAGLRRRADDLEGAAALYTQVIEHRRRQPDGDAMGYAASLNNLAVTRRMQERYEEAATLYQEALDTTVSILGAGHPTSLMFAGNLARAYTDGGRSDRALEVYRARVEAARKQWPDGDAQVASMLMNLGGHLVLSGREAEAIAPLREAVAMLERVLEPDHSWTAVYRAWLGAAATLAGQQRLGATELDRSFASLSRYAGLRQDRSVTGMLEAFTRHIEKRGLTGPAARYRTLLGPATP